MQFSDYAGSESGEEQNLRGIKAELESVPKTPTKAVLPEEYDASSGHTPPGFEGTWRETNARCGTARHLVPGHTSSPPAAARPTWPFLRGHAALEEVRGPMAQRSHYCMMCARARAARREAKGGAKFAPPNLMVHVKR
jgi:hypothetical protein